MIRKRSDSMYDIGAKGQGQTTKILVVLLLTLISLTCFDASIDQSFLFQLTVF